MAADNKQIYESGISPEGVGIYVWLEKPDTKFGKSQFKTGLVLDKGTKANDEFAKKLNALHKAAGGKKSQNPVKDGDDIADDNDKKENLRGKWVVQFKSKNKPTLVDAKKNSLAVPPRSGDLLRVAYSVKGMQGDGDAGYKGAVLYLNKVQLLERRNHGNSGPDFDEADGYEADSAEAPIKGNNEDGDGPQDDGSGDF